MDPFIRDFKNNLLETVVFDKVQDCENIMNKELKFSILHVNIRSMAKNFEQLEVLLHQFRTDFDCLVLTETWQIAGIDIFKLNGYDIVYNEGRYNQNDGVVVWWCL